MRVFLVLVGCVYLLWALVSQLNHTLSGLRITLFAGGLFVAYAAVSQPLRLGLAVSLIGGLWCDANAPVWFGTHGLLFVLAHATLFHVRDRVPREDAAGAIVLVLLCNLALFLVFSFTQISASPAPGTAWPRLLFDLFCSQVFLALVTPWFFALQKRALALARFSRGDYA